MGLGGYLAAKSDAEHYANERRREIKEVREIPKHEIKEVTEIFMEYGLTAEESKPVVEALCKDHDAWVDFMIRFELGLEKPNPNRALTSALTIAGAYVAGGFIPLSPYMFSAKPHSALFFSIFITLAALLIFGYIKGRFTGTRPLRSDLQTTLIGGLAAGAAFFLARALS